jgi:hypothetical protein
MIAKIFSHCKSTKISNNGAHNSVHESENIRYPTNQDILLHTISHVTVLKKQSIHSQVSLCYMTEYLDNVLHAPSLWLSSNNVARTVKFWFEPPLSAFNIICQTYRYSISPHITRHPHVRIFSLPRVRNIKRRVPFTSRNDNLKSSS